MAKKKEQTPRSGVWMMTLDRFGYDLVVAGRTKEEAEQAMREEYIRAYAKWNVLDEDSLRAALVSPVLDEDGNVDEFDECNEFVRYYHSAFEDAEPRFYEYGKVVWE